MSKRADSILDLADHVATTLIKKDAAYGSHNLSKYGMLGIIVRLNDKLNRLETLYFNPKVPLNDESIQDTLLDIAGYAMLASLYVEENR